MTTWTKRHKPEPNGYKKMGRARNGTVLFLCPLKPKPTYIAAMTVSILMVCLGNICRSPMAEGALRAHAEAMKLSLHIDSAGTGDWHIGHPPDKRAQHAALSLGGVDLSSLRARQVSAADFHAFDHIVAMDQSNLANLRAMQPTGGKAQLSLLLDHSPGHVGKPVADPYYGGPQDFALCWQMVNDASRSLAEKIMSGFA
jgi:protein-tyrosine phosphatase